MKTSLLSLGLLALASMALADKPNGDRQQVEAKVSNNLRLSYNGDVQVVELPKFPPSLGTLQSATIKVYQRPTFDFQAYTAPGGPVLHQFYATTTLQIGNQSFTDTAFSSQRGGYADANGVYTYSGTLGDPNKVDYGKSFGGFVGNGTFKVYVSSTARVETNAPRYDFAVNGNSNVVVTYTFIPKK